MRLRVLYHGHCFDGVASAATFTRFYQERVHPGSDIQYGGLLHRPGNLFDEAVIEGEPDERFIERIIRDLTRKSLAEVATSAEVGARFQPILKLHRETLEAIRRKAIYDKDVVQFDLVDEGYEGFNKFIPYYLFPDATYTVALTRAPQRTKISVGSNPWAPRPRRHNIATICERYGGGGHAGVGAISLAPDEVDQARKAMGEIVEELSRS